MPELYFDHNATTPLLPEVGEFMLECLRAGFGNPSSIHWAGREARRRIEDAREILSRHLEVASSEIIFTSGGTESDHLALRGSLAALRERGRHVVTTSFEHPAVLECCRKLELEGWEVSYIPPDSDGVVAPESVERALRADTVLVSVMAANNEIGTLQPVAAIGRLLRERHVLFHCDAVQALGRVRNLKPREWCVDIMSFSAHKLGGPKGTGALYIRKGIPFAPLQVGGSQERQLRAGTENVAGIAGFAKAVELLGEGNGEAENGRMEELRDKLEAALLARIPDLEVNGKSAPRLPNTLNVTLPGCRADMMVMALDMQGLAISAGSACASGSVKQSHVILAMGKGQDAAASSLRFSLGRGNTEAQIPLVAELVADAVESVRGL